MDSSETTSAQPNLPPNIRHAPGLTLTAAEAILLTRAFPNNQEIFVEREFRSGYSGAVVLLVSPGSGQAQVVVKLGSATELQQEYAAYRQYVEHTSPQNTARLQDKPLLTEDEQLALLKYTFAGGDPRQPKHSLQAYYDSQDGQATAAILDRVFRVYGRQWWAFNRPQKFVISEQYDRLLPVHLRLKSVVLGSQAQMVLSAGHINATVLRELQLGQLVRLQDFSVIETHPDRNEVTLTTEPPKGEASAPLRLRVETAKTNNYRPGDQLETLDAVVTATRHTLLAEIAGLALPAFDQEATHFSLNGRTFSNPLLDLSDLLDRVVETRVSTIHGDLNLQNILVDKETGFAWLIDFAETRRGPALFDLQRLEGQVITKLLPPAITQASLEPVIIVELFESLHADPLSPVAPYSALQKPYIVLVTIRRLARQYLMDDRDWDEYYLGLAITLLGSLKYAELETMGRQLALAGAAVTQELIGVRLPFLLMPSPPTLDVPYQVPGLPPHFIVRAKSSLVKGTLLAPNQPSILAIQGMGGLGKTTLAIALTHEPEIRKHFKDGILWASLGTGASVDIWQVAWGEALGLDLQKYPDSATKATRLREFLASKTCLLVIDDVWPEINLWDLLVGGPTCRMLVTTRHASVRQKIGAKAIKIDVLEQSQALTLLSAWAERELTTEPLAVELVHRLGYLPLAVTLAGAQLLDGAELADLLQSFQAQQGDLTSLDLENPQSKEESLKQTFDLSIQRLSSADRLRFARLGVFVANEPFDTIAIKTVWQDESPAKNIRLLIRHGLLNQTEISSDDDDDSNRRHLYTLHPLLRDYAHSLLDDSERVVAIQCHSAHYLHVAEETTKDWWTIEQDLGQIRGVWQRLKRADDEQLFDFIAAMQPFFERYGLWNEWLDWTNAGLTLARKFGKSTQVSLYLNNLAYAQNALGRWAEALTNLEQALASAQELGDKAQIAICLNNIGGIYHNRGDLERALDNYEQALTIDQDLDHQTNVAIHLSNIGRIYHSRGNLNQAMNHYEQALSIEHTLDNQIGIAIILSDIAGIYYQQGDLAQALAHYEQAKIISQELEDKAQTASCLNNIGGIYHDQGDLKQALDNYERALIIAQEIGHKIGIANGLGNIGEIYFDQGELERALANYEQALTINQEIGYKAGIVKELGHIGGIYHDQGDLKQALDNYKQALIIAQEMGHKIGIANGLGNIGEIYFDQGELERALANYEQALTINQEIGYKAGIARELQRIGQVYIAQRHFLEAKKILEQTVDLFRMLDSPKVEKAQAYLDQARTGLVKLEK